MQCMIIDLDGSLPSQPSIRAALGSGHATLVEARDLAGSLRILASRKALLTLTARIEAAGGLAPLTFYGSGDFHHLCALLLQQMSEPFILLHFDNHPDWTTFPATFNCGAWVNRALESPMLERVVTIGPTGSDFLRPQWKAANFSAIRQGRLEVHPWRAPPAWLLGGAIAAPACRTEGYGPLRRLVWQQLADMDWNSFCADLDQRLPHLPLWVTLDKDVLMAEEAVTNWDQGGMRLDAILALTSRLVRRRRILGMDVCGDASPPIFCDPFRAFLSATDRPRFAPDPMEACAVNDVTNARLLSAARSLFS